MADSGIVIRRGRPDDAARINALVRASMIDNSDFSCLDPRAYWVAYDGQRLVGCARLRCFAGVAAILTTCVVDRDYRRQGIGTAFVRLRLAEARRRGMRVAALCTMYYHFRHFKKLGFRTVPRAQLPECVRRYPQFTEQRYMKCAVMIRTV